jgi:NADPH:quinone reductase
MLGHHVGTQKDLEWRSGDVFRWIAEKKLTLRTEHTYRLGEAAQAHLDLQGRKTTGS